MAVKEDLEEAGESGVGVGVEVEVEVEVEEVEVAGVEEVVS